MNQIEIYYQKILTEFQGLYFSLPQKPYSLAMEHQGVARVTDSWINAAVKEIVLKKQILEEDDSLTGKIKKSVRESVGRINTENPNLNFKNPFEEEDFQTIKKQISSSTNSITSINKYLEFRLPILINNIPKEFKSNIHSLNIDCKEFPTGAINAKIVEISLSNYLILIENGLLFCAHHWSKFHFQNLLIKKKWGISKKDPSKAILSLKLYRENIDFCINSYINEGFYPISLVFTNPTFFADDVEVVASQLTTLVIDFVVAHELAHLCLGHFENAEQEKITNPVGQTIKCIDTKNKEMLADRLAFIIMWEKLLSIGNIQFIMLDFIPTIDCVFIFFSVLSYMDKLSNATENIEYPTPIKRATAFMLFLREHFNQSFCDKVELRVKSFFIEDENIFKQTQVDLNYKSELQYDIFKNAPPIIKNIVFGALRK